MIRARQQVAHELHDIAESSDVAATRRAAATIATNLGGSQVEVEQVRLIVTELGTNILQHGASDGYLLIRAVDDDQTRGVEVIAVNSHEPLENRRVISLSGLGLGLDVVQRHTSFFDAYMPKDKRTIVLARVLFSLDNSAARKIDCGGISTSILPGLPNGDDWAFLQDDDKCTIFVFDGLGHGPGAAVAADAADASFRNRYHGNAEVWIRELHSSLQGTRGGVGAVAEIDLSSRRISFYGVGNISGRVMSEERMTGVMLPGGVIGTEHPLPTLRPVEFAFPPGAVLLMWSDGIGSRVSLDEYSQLIGHDSAVVAAALHRDFSKKNDDSTIIVAQDLQGR